MPLGKARAAFPMPTHVHRLTMRASAEIGSRNISWLRPNRGLVPWSDSMKNAVENKARPMPWSNPLELEEKDSITNSVGRSEERL